MKQPVLLYPPEIAANFIAEQEGFSGLAYKCPAGVWTVGFGHEGDAVTRSEAFQMLLKDLVNTQEDLAVLVKVPVTENQFIALMSFVYNFGITKCRRYTLFKKVNEEDPVGIKEWWPAYCSPGTVFEKGLKARRLRELELFFRK